MEFVDYREIRIRSGDGGPGMVSFKSAHNRPKLGADGGDGGFGGHVYLRGNKSLNTLSRLYHKKLYAAEHGQKGGTNGKTGRNGEDCIIDVPLGTIAQDMESQQVLTEVLEHDTLYKIAEGGIRGLGNQRYLSATHQAPQEASRGTPGQSCEVALELKLIADVGFAGFPNAGKSTLLSSITNATPKVADYPFTTLIPHLGIVEMGDLDNNFGASFVAADIPGLIEGASEGRGLGHEFLKHLERTKVIAYIVDPFDVEGHEPLERFQQLRAELERYSTSLHSKPGLIVLTKFDIGTCDDESEWDLQPLYDHANELNFQVLKISSATGFGLNELKIALFALIEAHKAQIELNKAAAAQAHQDKQKAMADGWKIPDDYEIVSSSTLNQNYGIHWS